MLYTITAVSPEVEDFAIELQIESDATFADLHNLIRKSCGWEDLGSHLPSATFYLCDDHWHRRKAIREKSYEDDTMDEVELGDHLEDEGQRLIYLFDPDNARKLLLEVSRISFGKHIDAPHCRRSHGTAPILSIEPDPATIPEPATAPAAVPDGLPSGHASLLAELNAAALAGEGFDDEDLEPTDDDDLFDLEEIDPEGFDIAEE